ncbi:hypothetical protein GSI_04002 [Ganoderma sinense ZZ0214-1]|uniref:Uncharacterized protein n=1 Tax=Ganoderma sinense ZZ0214-1 TaxID=1077348 RepID=A0A2G8SHZ5_9APHY|nr:hypothetical protein GSI_04002 [Ganoderma sinense ZZ0214-1]
MGLFYEYKPPHPDEQHQRLVALRQLTSRGIPCILWGEDALNYVHSVPTSLFDQQILVPDDLLDSASSVLQEGPYYQVPFTEHYSDYFGCNVGKSPFPLGILLKHPDIPDHQPYKLDPLPGYILLLPQSYFGLDVRSKERFQSLVPPLPSSNADILAPKFNTLLEGLVAFNLNPPIPNETPHARARVKHDIFIGYLLRYRVKYEDDGDTPPPKEILPEERAILDELQTEDARWYIGVYVGERRLLSYAEFIEYNRQKALRSSDPITEVVPAISSPPPSFTDA